MERTSGGHVLALWHKQGNLEEVGWDCGKLLRVLSTKGDSETSLGTCSHVVTVTATVFTDVLKKGF